MLSSLPFDALPLNANKFCVGPKAKIEYENNLTRKIFHHQHWERNFFYYLPPEKSFDKLINYHALCESVFMVFNIQFFILINPLRGVGNCLHFSFVSWRAWAEYILRINFNGRIFFGEISFCVFPLFNFTFASFSPPQSAPLQSEGHNGLVFSSVSLLNCGERKLGSINKTGFFFPAYKRHNKQTQRFRSNN